jgi:hypothetical protein
MELLAELLSGFFGIVVESAADGGRGFLRDVSAILTGRKVRNRRKQGTVC